MSDHSILAPSGGGVWAKPDGCRAYPTVSLLYPELSDDQDAREGTAAHQIVEELGVAYAISGDVVEWGAFEGRAADNGEPYTREMYDCALEFFQWVCTKTGGVEAHPEDRLDISTVHQRCYGFCDLWWYDPAKREIHIADFKYGRKSVSAFMNYQLLIYLFGVLAKLNLLPLDLCQTRVYLHIYQPRAYRPIGSLDTWDLVATGGQFEQILAGVRQAAVEALGENPIRRSGAHCRYCPARFDCGEATQAGWSYYEAASASVPVNLNNRQLAVHLMLIEDAIERLTFLKTGCEAQADHIISQGGIVPGYSLQAGRSTTTWDKPIETVVNAGKLLGVDISKPGALTPKQAKAAGLNPDVVDALSETRSGALKLKQTNASQIERYFKYDRK